MTCIKEPLTYIEEFNMLSNNQDDFDRMRFLDAFYWDFLEFLRKNPGDDTHNGSPKYSRWRQVVDNYFQKFHVISRLRKNLSQHKQGLTPNLWGMFYAQYLIPERDRRYPNKAREIYAFKRKKIQAEQDKINAQQYR